MIRSAAGKVMWVGRATVFLVGLAVILALIFGVASTALGANGDNFILGKKNVARAMSTLVKQGAGPALKLQVGAGQPPLAVNSTARVANLNAATAGRADSAASADSATNADNLDGKDATQIGVNGLQRVSSSTASDSNSPKFTSASCPTGKILVGTGYDIVGGKSGSSPNTLADVVVDELNPFTQSVFIDAYEEDPTSASWSVTVYAICALAP